MGSEDGTDELTSVLDEGDMGLFSLQSSTATKASGATTSVTGETPSPISRKPREGKACG